MSSLLKPGSIAVVGASESGYGGRVVTNLICGGFGGAIYPVNPNRDNVQGLPAFRDVAEVPGPVDLVVIAVRADLVPQALDACGRKGVRGCVVVTAGFEERGPEGVQLIHEVRRLAHHYGIRFVGPNSLGVANLTDRIYATAAAFDWEVRFTKSGGVSLISQSGALAFGPLLTRGCEKGVGFRFVVSVGNQSDVTIPELIDYLVTEDEETRVIAVFMEGLREGDGRHLAEAAARAMRAGKPVCVLKIGRTERGRDAARTHTAALAGDDEVFDGCIRQSGALRVGDLDDLLYLASLLSASQEVEQCKISFLSNSGGLNSLVSDFCGREGVEFATLSETTLHGLARVLQGFGHAGNPADVTGHIGRETLRDLVLAVDRDPETGLIGIGITVPTWGKRATEIAGRIIALQRECSKPITVLWSSAWALTGMASSGVSELAACGIPITEHPERFARSVRLLQDFKARRQRLLVSSSQGATRVPKCRSALAGRDLVGLQESLDVVAAAGIPVEPLRRANSLKEARVAVELTGFPVVLKVYWDGLYHKTDVGAVRVVHSSEELTKAWMELHALAESHRGTVFLQRYIDGGVEVIVGGRYDPAFGPVVAIGLGGVYAELFRDVVFRMCPVTRDEVLEMIQELRLKSLLFGFRGRRKCDIDALADAVVAFSEMVAAMTPAIKDIEINPLMVLPDGEGARAVDARIS